MSLRRLVAAPAPMRLAVAMRFGGHSHASHAEEHHHEEHHDDHGDHGHGHGGHGHGHGHHHHHEQKLLTKLPLGPKYPGGKKWGLFHGVDEDPTTFGRVCLCFISTYLYFVYYYQTMY